MTYDKRRIEKSQYVLGVKPRTLGAPIAAQAGDEPMAYTEQLRAAVETVCEGWTLPAGARKTLEAALWAPQVSPRATPAVTDALQVCVKALEFRKERSANDEFALNLARIALAGSPCATADVEREKLPHGHRDDFYLMANARSLSMKSIHTVRSMPNWVLAMKLFATGSTSAKEICARAGIDPDGISIERATTKPGA